SYSINPTRVSAINGWELSLATKGELFGPYPIKLRGGEIGCLLSHLSVIKDAACRKFSLIWICEDDIDIKENPFILQDLVSSLSSYDPEWDLFFTDSNTKNNYGDEVISFDLCVRPDQPHYPIDYYRTRSSVTEDIERIGQRFGLYSVLISSNGLKKIIEY